MVIADLYLVERIHIALFVPAIRQQLIDLIDLSLILNLIYIMTPTLWTRALTMYTHKLGGIVVYIST
jgi:hypothetical protein